MRTDYCLQRSVLGLVIQLILPLCVPACGEGFSSKDAPKKNSMGDSGTHGDQHDAGGTDAGPEIPTDDLMLWLRGDRGMMVDNGFVSIWADQSGNHADAVQTASDVRPRFVEDGIGGRPALEFDGIDDFMKLPAGFDDFSRGISIFATIQPASSDSCSAVVEMSNGSEVDDISFGQSLNLETYEVFDQYSEGEPIPSDAPQLVAVVHNPNLTFEMRRNGTLAGQGMADLPAVISREQNFVGRTLYVSCVAFAGRISELLIYSRSVSDVELLQIEGYMRARSNCCGG